MEEKPLKQECKVQITFYMPPISLELAYFLQIQNMKNLPVKEQMRKPTKYIYNEQK